MTHPRQTEQQEHDAVEAIGFVRAAMRGDDDLAAEIVNRHVKILDSSSFLGTLTGLASAAMSIIEDGTDGIAASLTDAEFLKMWRATNLALATLHDVLDE